MFRIISPGSQGTSLEANNDSKQKMLFSSYAGYLILHQQIAVLVHYLALMPKFEIIVKSMIFWDIYYWTSIAIKLEKTYNQGIDRFSVC